MADQELRGHTDVLLGLTELCAQGRLSEFSKVLTIDKRKKFMDFISDYENEVNDEFKAAYLDFLGSIHNKINPKIFEIILRIGVNFMDDDAFWFHLINILDYGAIFDEQEVLFLLTDLVLKQDENSWKATCLLCILIQDYPNMKTSCAKNLTKVHEELYSILSSVKDFSSSSYLVELVTQLESKPLISLIFKDDPNLYENFPGESCYANDEQCFTFLKQLEFDQSIYKYQSCEIGSDLTSGQSHCQITKKYLIALLDHNDFASPIQFDLPNIKNVRQDGKRVIFNLSQSVKKALINVEISQFASVYFEFGSKRQSDEFFKSLNATINNSVLQTPRKISVAKNFIALNGEFGDAEVESDINEASQDANDDENEQPSTNNTTNSGNIDETESIFGSPINTTKDTSVMKKGRAVSTIVAESKDSADVPKTNPLAFLEIPNRSDNENGDNYEQVPDSLDETLKTFRNPPVNRGPSDVVIESDPKATASNIPAQKANGRAKSDIWDFDSDPLEQEQPNDNPKATSTVNNTKYRSKAMKCLAANTKTVEKSKPPRKQVKKNNQANVKGKVNTKLHNSHKTQTINTSRLEHSSMDVTEHNNNDSFQPLTSPLVCAHERAKTRAYSRAQSTQQETPTRKRKSGEDDESYRDDEEVIVQPSRKTRKTAAKSNAKNQGNEPVKPRNTRGRKNKQAENLELGKPEKEKSVPAKANQSLKSTKKTTGTNRFNSGLNSAIGKEQANAILESTRLFEKPQAVDPNQTLEQQIRLAAQPQLPSFTTGASLIPSAIDANSILSEAYTNTLQRQIFESINSFSNQLVNKIRIINDGINKKFMNDLTTKYENLFNELRESFQTDVDEMCGFIADVKGLVNLPEEELVEYIKQNKLGPNHAAKR